jgi:hypothetical protein
MCRQVGKQQLTGYSACISKSVILAVSYIGSFVQAPILQGDMMLWFLNCLSNIFLLSAGCLSMILLLKHCVVTLKRINIG